MSSLDAKTIKSAERVLHVLEYFDSKRTKATVMEISRQLGYPQSSTSELLRCLVKMGYLNYDRYRRTYEPTARVPLLGAWVQPGLFRHGHLLPMLDEISRATGETVTLSSLIGLEVHYIHVVPPRDGTTPMAAQGATRKLLNSSTGRLYLSGYPETRVRELVHRLNAEEPNPERRVRLPNLEVELKRIRQQGYSAEYGEFDTGFGAMNALLACRNGQTLAVGVAGTARSVQANAEEYLAVIRSAMKQMTRPPVREEMHVPVPTPKPAVFEQRMYATA
ncbi:MAG TPA: helix-turn-helix domain-containing protein [Acetobacteraceae bacterium]|nr:helix-turn-helix domain-containing protein [Acetobacteraceae bacterium]